MTDTSASLLERLRSDADDSDWQRLVDLYEPLIRGWLRRHSASRSDVDDLVQEVLAVVVRRMPTFERQERTGSFRSWLRTITVNCLRDSWRAKKFRPVATGNSDFRQVLEQMADPGSELSRIWNDEHDQHVMQMLLEQLKGAFKDATWRAFKGVSIDGHAAEAVAEQLGITVNAVYIAKSRVMSRLRQEGRGLIDC